MQFVILGVHTAVDVVISVGRCTLHVRLQIGPNHQVGVGWVVATALHGVILSDWIHDHDDCSCGAER